MSGSLGDSGMTNPRPFNDLWTYRAGQWTWMAGLKVTNQKGAYGTQGVAAASNVPGARLGAYNWIDASGISGSSEELAMILPEQAS
jgi:hypothetical protein